MLIYKGTLRCPQTWLAGKSPNQIGISLGIASSCCKWAIFINFPLPCLITKGHILSKLFLEFLDDGYLTGCELSNADNRLCLVRLLPGSPRTVPQCQSINPDEAGKNAVTQQPP